MWPQPILAILFMPFGFIAPKSLNYLAFQSFDFVSTWWRFFQKRVIHTKLDIYVFIIINIKFKFEGIKNYFAVSVLR